MKLNPPRPPVDQYIRFGSVSDKQLNYKDLFTLKADSGQTPWVPSRFTQKDLLKRIASRRLSLNDLNFVPEEGSAVPYEMFPRLGRFNPRADYDVTIGRPSTFNFPEQQPDYDPNWLRDYTASPVIAPEEKTKNPFPRLSNLDPNGYLTAMVEEGTTTSIPSFPDLINENAQAKTSIG